MFYINVFTSRILEIDYTINSLISVDNEQILKHLIYLRIRGIYV